jgi:hypothetical protein
MTQLLIFIVSIILLSSKANALSCLPLLHEMMHGILGVHVPLQLRGKQPQDIILRPVPYANSKHNFAAVRSQPCCQGLITAITGRRFYDSLSRKKIETFESALTAYVGGDFQKTVSLLRDGPYPKVNNPFYPKTPTILFSEKGQVKIQNGMVKVEEVPNDIPNLQNYIDNFIADHNAWAMRFGGIASAEYRTSYYDNTVWLRFIDMPDVAVRKQNGDLRQLDASKPNENMVLKYLAETWIEEVFHYIGDSMSRPIQRYMTPLTQDLHAWMLEPAQRDDFLEIAQKLVAKAPRWMKPWHVTHHVMTGLFLEADIMALRLYIGKPMAEKEYALDSPYVLRQKLREYMTSQGFENNP